MAAPPRTATAGTFFLTAITANRRRLFQVEANARLLLDTLQHYRQKDLYKLHAFVVMPDHLHLLLTTEDLPKAMQHLRGGFSHSLASKLAVWQRGYTDHLIRSRAEYDTRLTYIQQNLSARIWWSVLKIIRTPPPFAADAAKGGGGKRRLGLRHG